MILAFASGFAAITMLMGGVLVWVSFLKTVRQGVAHFKKGKRNG